MTDGELLLAAIICAGFGTLQPSPWWKALFWFGASGWFIVLWFLRPEP